MRNRAERKSGNATPIRTFIAVGLGEDLQRRLGRIIGELKTTCPGVKWVAPENIHLTLKFLGNVDPEKLGGIGKVLDGVAGRHAPWEEGVEGLGGFPGRKKPRVIWVRFRPPHRRLQQLVRDLEEGLSPLGFEAEKRKYVPHLTLGRIKKISPPAVLEPALARVESESRGCVKIDVLLCVKSTLSSSGARYTIISEHPLTG